MGNVDAFLKSLLAFDKDNIPLACVEKCEKDFLINPGFNPDAIRSKSGAAAGLCGWVVNICKYFRIYQVNVIANLQGISWINAHRLLCLLQAATACQSAWQHVCTDAAAPQQLSRGVSHPCLLGIAAAWLHSLPETPPKSELRQQLAREPDEPAWLRRWWHQSVPLWLRPTSAWKGPTRSSPAFVAKSRS